MKVNHFSSSYVQDLLEFTINCTNAWCEYTYLQIITQESFDKELSDISM